MQRRRVAAAAGRGWIPPSPAMPASPTPTGAPSTTQMGAMAGTPMGAPSATRMGAMAGTKMGALAGTQMGTPSATRMGAMAGTPPMGAVAGTSSVRARTPFSTGAQLHSNTGARVRLPTPTVARGASTFGARHASDGVHGSSSSSYSDLLQSSDGFMSYMMDEHGDLPENSQFVGHVGQQHNSPIDIEGEEEDGDGVRTVVRLFWKPEEDERVMSAWLKHSIDSIKGNNKKAEQYWSDVAEEYNLTTPSDRHRSRKQVKERWHKVNKWANLFNDCYLQIRRIYTSGYSEDMWLEKAHEMYVKESKGSHFVLMNVWNMVRNQAKWMSYNSPVQNKNKRKDLEEENNLEGDGLEDLDLPRPMGQKKAKKIASENKGKSKESAIDVDELDRFEQIQNGVHANRVKFHKYCEFLFTNIVSN